jgi:hypothetical protein
LFSTVHPFFHGIPGDIPKPFEMAVVHEGIEPLENTAAMGLRNPLTPDGFGLQMLQIAIDVVLQRISGMVGGAALLAGQNARLDMFDAFKPFRQDMPGGLLIPAAGRFDDHLAIGVPILSKKGWGKPHNLQLSPPADGGWVQMFFAVAVNPSCHFPAVPLDNLDVVGHYHRIGFSIYRCHKRILSKTLVMSTII